MDLGRSHSVRQVAFVSLQTKEKKSDQVNDFLIGYRKVFVIFP